MGIKTITCRLRFNQAAITNMLNRKSISYHTLKGNNNIEDEISSKFKWVPRICERKILCKLPGIKKIKKNKKGNLIRFDRALVLKVRVFGTRKWPIIISDGSGRIKVYRPGLYGLNRDRAGRSPELLCVLSTRSYFTLASVVMKDIMVQFRLGACTPPGVILLRSSLDLRRLSSVRRQCPKKTVNPLSWCIVQGTYRPIPVSLYFVLCEVKVVIQELELGDKSI